MATILSNPTIEVKASVAFVDGTKSGQAIHTAKGSPVYDAAPVAGQMNAAVAVDVQVVNNATPYVIDLTNVRDLSGNTVIFAHLTQWVVQNLSATPGQDVTPGGGANPAIPADTAIPAGDFTAKSTNNPGTVVDPTHKNFQLAVAAGVNVPVRVTLWGRTT